MNESNVIPLPVKPNVLLRAWMRENDVSVGDLARLIGAKPESVSQWVADLEDPPTNKWAGIVRVTGVLYDVKSSPLANRTGTGKTRMLPVYGQRKACLEESACLDELVRAHARGRDVYAASCPTGCASFEPVDQRGALNHEAQRRSGVVW